MQWAVWDMCQTKINFEKSKKMQVYKKFGEKNETAMIKFEYIL